jgi:lysophospholipase L1-like esterase
VVVGDSLTEGGEWWELLERPVANRGVTGDTVAAVRARLDDVAALDPRIVFVGVGINDLLAGASPEALAARHAALIAELRGRLPRARIVAESLLPIRDELVARDAELTSATVRRANELCRRGATAAGAEWLDVHARLADPDGELDPRYSSDGLHLSGAGYRAWAAAVLPYLP